MKKSTREARICALDNAAQLIQNHVGEGGLDAQDFPDFTLSEYEKECNKVAAMLFSGANSLREKK